MCSTIVVLFSVISMIFSVISTDGRLLTDTNQGRISGGQYASKGEFPGVVFIYAPQLKWRCVGSIVHRQWILTAAHCLDPLIEAGYVGPIVVRAGSNLAHHFGQEHNVSGWIRHEYYFKNGSICRHDIALLKLATPIAFDEDVQNIELETTDVIPIDSECTGLGWGRTSEEPQSASNMLLYHQTRIVSDSYCTKHSLLPIYPSNVCSVGIDSSDTCHGDSGGPLICNNKQVGILSFGDRSCKAKRPAVYVRVSMYTEWINKWIHGSCSCTVQ